MDTPDINKTILAADDSLANRLLLKKIFSSECRVLLAGSGSEALDIMRARPGEIDALLLDLIMPGMSGFDVLQVMVNDPQLSRIPVVVITAASAEDDIIKAMDLGAADVILKPFSPHVALHRVRNILTRVDNNRLAEENRLYTELLRRSEMDDKTKLYNKNGFYRHAQELLDKYPKTHFSLVRMDIDKFKVYNEVFGYAAGDELLRSIAQSLPAGEKTVSGRLEADHFAFILMTIPFRCAARHKRARNAVPLTQFVEIW